VFSYKETFTKSFVVTVIMMKFICPNKQTTEVTKECVYCFNGQRSWWMDWISIFG